MQKNISIIGTLFFMLCPLYFLLDCGNDYSGTYRVHKKDGYVTPAYDLVINEDGSARVDVDGGEFSYGSWVECSGGLWITMDDNFDFVFGYYNPFLDIKENRLYVSRSAYDSKHPQKFFRVTKK